MNVAFVENAENNIDGDERGQDEQRLVGSEALKEEAVPWKEAKTDAGIWSSFCAFSTASAALPKAAPGARLKEMVTQGNCP